MPYVFFKNLKNHDLGAKAFQLPFILSGCLWKHTC